MKNNHNYPNHFAEDNHSTVYLCLFFRFYNTINDDYERHALDNELTSSPLQHNYTDITDHDFSGWDEGTKNYHTSSENDFHNYKNTNYDAQQMFCFCWNTVSNFFNRRNSSHTTVFVGYFGRTETYEVVQFYVN